MGVPTPQFSATITGHFLMYQGNETVTVDAGEVWINDNAPKSLAASGYQVLPSGLVFQWGKYAGGGDTTISFPIAFPTALLGVVATPQYAASATTLVAATVASGSTTGFSLYVRYANGSSTGAAGEAVYWMAWGY